MKKTLITGIIILMIAACGKDPLEDVPSCWRCTLHIPNPKGETTTSEKLCDSTAKQIRAYEKRESKGGEMICAYRPK